MYGLGIQTGTQHLTVPCCLTFLVSHHPQSWTQVWKIPKDIKLADEQFDQLGSIDLLIGSDLFYEMLQSDRRTRPRNYQLLQETALGWKLLC